MPTIPGYTYDMQDESNSMPNQTASSLFNTSSPSAIVTAAPPSEDVFSLIDPYETNSNASANSITTPDDNLISESIAVDETEMPAPSTPPSMISFVLTEEEMERISLQIDVNSVWRQSMARLNTQVSRMSIGENDSYGRLQLPEDIFNYLLEEARGLGSDTALDFE